MLIAKHIMFMCLIFSLIGCGQKSVIKPKTAAQKFAEAYGDGDLVRRSIPLVITTNPKATLPDFGFLFGGIAKMLGNIVVALGAGRTELYFHQPTPELPEQIKEVRLKRVFFYIEPKANGSRRVNWFSRLFRGKGNVDFNFIKKLLLRVKPERPDMKKVCLVQDQGKYEPLMPCKDPDISYEKTQHYLNYFKLPVPEFEPNLEELDEFVILKYDGSKESKLNSTRGDMYMFRTQRPGETLHFLNNRNGYKGLIENMLPMDNVILVELKKDPVVKETFEIQLARDAEYIDATLGVEEIEECNESICLDVKVEEANLVPFLKRMNSNRIDAFIDAGKIPETFQLKGFVEFELGAELEF